jgi:hypothetical protein
MSEPRWNDASTRPLSRDTQGTYATQRTRNVRAPAGYGLPPSAERSPRWGGLPAGRGIVVMIATTAVGTVITILSGGDPGFMLGFCLVIGAIAASLAIRPGAVYRIFPAPALAYVVGAVIAGLLHDGGADDSRAALAISAAQWIASGFLAMTAATVLVILIAAVRWSAYWYGSGAVGPRGAMSPGSAARLRSNNLARTTGSLRSTDTPRSAGSPRSAGNPRSAGSPRGAGNPRSTGGAHSAGGPRSTGSPRGTASPRSAAGPRSTGSPRGTGGAGSPARPPNAGDTGSRGHGDPPPRSAGPLGY